jgi:DNA replication protein DnaC
MFDLNKFRNITSEANRYNRRIDALHSKGINTQHIEKAAQEAIDNLKSGAKSFVIYGEPQSGKTEMMIALTAKLLDEGHFYVSPAYTGDRSVGSSVGR